MPIRTDDNWSRSTKKDSSNKKDTVSKRIFLRFNWDSPIKYKLFDLNLLFLSSQNHFAEFHTELELLPTDIIKTNEFIKQPLALEQYLIEAA
jgi:hypothetical protein